MVTPARDESGKFQPKSGGGDASASQPKPENGGKFKRDSESAQSVDPGSLDGSAASHAGESVGKRGRGRPKGTAKPAQSKGQASLDLSALNGLLYSCHAMLAAITDMPEMSLSEDESEKLAKAAANVARHYNIRAQQKTMDWANLCMALGCIYGPRMFAIKGRKNIEARARKTGAMPAQAGAA